MFRRVGQFLLLVIGAAVLAVLGVMAFMRRDHQVELVVSYPNSTPAEIWRLLTDHAAEPQWLPAFGTVTRQADIGGHDVWTHNSRDGAFSFTLMTVSAIPERRYERLVGSVPAAISVSGSRLRRKPSPNRWPFTSLPPSTGRRRRLPSREAPAILTVIYGSAWCFSMCRGKHIRIGYSSKRRCSQSSLTSRASPTCIPAGRRRRTYVTVERSIGLRRRAT